MPQYPQQLLVPYALPASMVLPLGAGILARPWRSEIRRSSHLMKLYLSNRVLQPGLQRSECASRVFHRVLVDLFWLRTGCSADQTGLCGTAT